MRRSVSLVFAVVCAFAQSTPTAEQVLDRYVEVTGGKAAHEKLRTEISVGTMEMKAQGIKGKMTGYRNSSNSNYSVVEVEGVGKIESGISNGIVWEKSALAGPRVKSGEEKALAEREAMLAKDLKWRDVYKAELAGEDTVDGAACYKIVLTPKDGGRPETRFYDKQTGLLTKATLVAATQMGDLPVETLAYDYKEFGGLKVPTRVVTKLAGQEMTVTISTVDLNKEIPASRFDLPPDIKALVDKQKK